ncbi:DNA mismatch repair endonuclease MutL [Bacillus sp. DTU_2020_1000418_1_SI_GHA_SEK_038]|uniref:DNA mismatch repair endonuclease MutL n=1 Tax=Bacillus sp. DTU_2020_1000418_1_SI_GHA_SEK_038 TaxID=3077585 RepID=UPI0028E49EBD|nr:DNA mismatch repair endonuclease MutL [Bacillus sp. DTU_2020_1000418_1_SI_GHA_SEK_038]WNS77255.1 DNA mismatch repair endonuclease MutL [Bacillus sp. DTU_2020_1000418_1_SI_GHA_SEK_038]
MGKIIQLDDALSNKIAAGEVVERPASVVKELVENSIDAGSTIIEIETEEAGLAKIRIIDNGDGIAEEDVLTAFQRHATSKIKDENDLFRIRTLGFRGEALPSIASVSKVEMKTSTGETGTRIVVEGGKLGAVEKAPARKGTDLVVSDLFFNTPARLKYMKTIHTELGNITDVVNRLALAHPKVSIRLIHNDRKLLQTNGNGDVRQVLAAIYGMNIVKKMIPIKASSLDFQISGYAAYPEVTRASRNYISTMINGRFIKNYALAKAIQEGYHTLLPIGRYPIVLININMDPLLVDVNVHPSKMEVRLSKEQELYELVIKTIKAAFKKEELIPAGFTEPKLMQPKQEQIFLQLDHIPEKKEFKEESFVHPAISSIVREESMSTEMTADDSEPKSEIVSTYVEHDFSTNEKRAETTGISNMEQVDRQERTRIPPLYPIGQMHGTYIFAQNEKGLFIIDQHAAQERIKYEFFKEKVGQVASELQEMLIPLTFDYSTDDYIKINEYKGELEKVGVFLEPFGHNSFIIRSHPQWLPKGEEKEIIEDMIEQLLSMKRVDIKKLREEAAIMMSCKASIKANHHLRNDEIQALLDELRQTSDPFTCPHGRPIIIHYSTYDMEKMFKRVM